ncbi:MAG: hypothetical protein NVS3B25_27050 [Hymenobacter sp.]
MNLADHIRPLLRDHDCVIIPDFGGLVADVSPARALPGRQALSPPTKLVAFNQSLTRNDGLLVDALSQHLGLPIAQAREAVRAAVAGLQQELAETNRTELPGIGIFRRATGRGLAFEYTGTDNLLASAFGLPELAARPVRANDARTQRLQPALRGTATRRSRGARVLPGGIIAMAAGLLLLANYQVALTAGYLPLSWQARLPKMAWAQQRPTTATPVSGPQQATLGQHDFSSLPAANGMTPLEAPAAEIVPTPALPASAALAKAGVPANSATVVEAAVSATPLRASKVVMPRSAAATGPVGAFAPKALASPAAPTIKTRTGRYYVIAGAYSSLFHAEQGRKVLARTGHAARIILPPYGSRLFRLTAADYPDLASAQREAQRLRLSTHCDYNTLKF